MLAFSPAVVAVALWAAGREGGQNLKVSVNQNLLLNRNNDMIKTDLKNHKVVSANEWLEARKQFLIQEKEFARLRDQLSRQRRALPWVKLDKEYIFHGPKGKETLSELFDGRSELIVYHFMFGPDWEAGCPHCSFWADNFNGIIVHLNHRDVTMVAVSRAPWQKLEA